MAAKKRSKQGGRKGSKTAFVLGLAHSMPAKDVVAKAAAQGMKLSEKYVYNVRSSHRSGPAKRPSPGRPAKRGRPARVRAQAGDGNLESRLRSAIAELGLARARQVFDEVSAAFGG